MDHFVFALNATLPVFLMIVLGYFLRKGGILNEGFCKAGDVYVFKVALPVSLFLSIASMDVYNDFDPKLCLFCFIATAVIFMGTWAGAALFLKDKRLVGAYSQAAARSSTAILGLALINNIYGHSGMMPMVILASVPFFNVYSVMILSFSPRTDEEGRLIPPEGNRSEAVRKTLVRMATNPIIIGILAGFPFALLRFTFPAFLYTFLKNVGNTATPVALLAIGGSFSVAGAKKMLGPSLSASFVKLVLWPGVVIAAAAALGFRETALVSILIMAGSPTTPACYVMARNMNQSGPLTSSVIVWTTLLSSLTVTLWLFVLRSAGMI